MTPRRVAGFTLVETVLFLVILAIATLGLAGVYGVLMTQLEQTLTTLPAHFLANARLEELMADAANLGWSQLVAANYPQERLDTRYQRQVAITEVSQAGPAWSCTATPGSAATNPKCLTVTVQEVTSQRLLAQARVLLWAAP